MVSEQSEAEKAAEEWTETREGLVELPYSRKTICTAMVKEQIAAFLAGAAWAAPKCNEALIERLKKSRKIIGALCKEGRCPRMSVPVQESDEDVFLCDSIDMAIKALSCELPAAPEVDK